MMAKGKTKRKRTEAVKVVEPLDGPTAAQLANGDYARETIIHGDTFRRETVHLNRGGTPLARWKRDKALTDGQIAAIDHCLRLWHIVGYSPRLVASYGERIPITGSSETMTNTQIDARDDLYRIIDYFPGPVRTYWNVFENICRHDMPAGVAGGELSKSNRTADARAHQVVCFVADVIAMKERL